MLEIKRFFLGRRALNYLPNKRDIVRMHPVEHAFDRGLGRGVVPEYSVAFRGPDDFSARDVPAKTAGVAKPLRLRQIGLALPQCVFRPLSILDVGICAIPSDNVSEFVA